MCTVFIVGTVHFLINHWWFPLYTEHKKKVFGGHSSSQSSCQEVTFTLIPAPGNWWYLLYWLARMSVCPALPHTLPQANMLPVFRDVSNVRCQDCQHTETRGPGVSRQTGNTSWHLGTQNSQTQKYSTIKVIQGSLIVLDGRRAKLYMK